MLDDAGEDRTTVPEPSAVGTIIGDDTGLAFTTGLPEISLVSRLAALLCVLCVLVVPTPWANPSARSEGFALASAQRDQMMKTLAPAVPPVLVHGTRK